jgi:hypothetical protein
MGRKAVGKKFSITIPLSTREEIERVALEEKRSLSQVIIILVDEALDHRKAKQDS